MARTYVIIGTGPSGVAAAKIIQDKDPDGRVTLFGADPHGFYSRPGLAYCLTGEISQRLLLLKHAKDFQHVKKLVVALHPQEHRIVTEDGGSHRYDKLLLATGSVAAKLSLLGSELKGVVKLDDMDDASEIIRIARKAKAAVVTGGGITALELVEGLVALGKETHYVLRSNRFWPNVLDEVESAIVEKRLKDHGVRLHYGSQLAQILGKRDSVAGVRTESGEAIECQLVAVAIGVQPRMELAKSAGLETDRGILTDEYLQTSADDVFAAGDVAQALDTSSGKTVLDTLWRTALAQGRVAGKNMAGERVRYERDIPFNVTRLAGLTTTIIGAVGQGKDKDLLNIARGDSETWRQLSNVMALQWNSEVNRTRVLLGTKHIVGAVVMGDQTLSRPLQELIARRVDITPIYDRLSSPNAPVADIIVDFWLTWSRTSGASQH